MQLDKLLNTPEQINIEYLKDNITEDQLLALYWYITTNESNFNGEELAALYEFLSQIDEKLKDEDEDDSIHT